MRDRVMNMVSALWKIKKRFGLICSESLELGKDEIHQYPGTRFVDGEPKFELQV